MTYYIGFCFKSNEGAGWVGVSDTQSALQRPKVAEGGNRARRTAARDTCVMSTAACHARQLSSGPPRSAATAQKRLGPPLAAPC